jgi:hypothetical protein
MVLGNGRDGERDEFCSNQRNNNGKVERNGRHRIDARERGGRHGDVEITNRDSGCRR